MINRGKIKIAAVLGAALMTAFSPAAALFREPAGTVFAAEQAGSVNATNVNVRSGPGTSYSKVAVLSRNAQVTVKEQVAGTDGNSWDHIRFDGGEGYISAQYVKIGGGSTSSAPSSGTGLGAFPASYQSLLGKLQKAHPNWTFKAVNTGLDWNTVISEESKVGRNMVERNSISSWKSTAEGAYDWSSGTWPGLDGSTWVAASSEIIAYYMDPRNFLTERGIFQFMEQSYDSSAQTRELLSRMVSGTFLAGSVTEGSTPSGGTASAGNSGSSSEPQGPGRETTAAAAESTAAESAAAPGPDAAAASGTTETYVDILMDAASESGVNPCMLAAMILEEQGNQGTGSSISGTVGGYSGIYNFFNIEAYTAGSMSAVQRGLWWASQPGTYGRPWNTVRRAIVGGAEWYGENYLSRGQSTLYLKKYNVTSSSRYQHQYMTNVEGAYEEGMVLSKNSALLDSAVTFTIPVYSGMPETACAKPAGDGSPNNKLSRLAVEGFAISPSFDRDTENYTVSVNSSVTSVNIDASAIDQKAKVSGAGTASLADGTTKVTITVTAQNGAVRSYVLSITRSDGGPLFSNSASGASTPGKTSSGSSSSEAVGPGRVTASSGTSSGKTSGGKSSGSTTSSSTSAGTSVKIISPADSAGSSSNYHVWRVSGPGGSKLGE